MGKSRNVVMIGSSSSVSAIQSDINARRKSNDEILPSTAEEGMSWPQAVAGVVRPARVPTTPCWLAPREGFSSLHPLLIQREEFWLALMSLCIVRTCIEEAQYEKLKRVY